MDVYEALAAARARGQRVALLTVLEASEHASSRTGAKMVATGEGALEGSLGCSEFDTAGVALAGEVLSSGGPLRRRVAFGGHGTEERSIEVFAEVHEPAPGLVVFAATPVGRAVAELGEFVGRRVTLVADDAVAPGWLRDHPPGPGDAVLLADHDAPYVDEVLTLALGGGAGFVGMLGSRRHAPGAVARLRASGVPEAHIARLRAPVGLDIGSRTPAEIALSIVAEVLAAANARGGGPLGLDWSAQAST